MFEDNIIHKLSKQFAIRTVRLCAYLNRKHQYDFIVTTIARQMLRSGTSIGANVRESRAAQSTADFISKLKIALKEGDECAYWLELLYENEYLTEREFTSIYNDNKQINATLVKIIKSTLPHC